MKTSNRVSEQLIAKVLVFGVVFSAAVVFVGGVLFLVQYGFEIHHNPVYSSTQAMLSLPMMLKGILKGIMEFEPFAIIMLGLFLLLITQFVRVFLTALYFKENKEYFYFWVSIVVFGLLVYSLVKSI